MAIQENFETTKSADRLQESRPNALATDLGERAEPGQLRQVNQQQTDSLVGKGILPPVELWTKQGDTRAAAPTRVAEAEKKETYGKQTEASKRTIEAVDKALDSSNLSGQDKNAVRVIVRAVAEGDTEKLQNLVDAAGRDPKGRQTLTKLVEQVNQICGKAGVGNLHLEYPLKDEDGTHWELQVSGRSKSGQRYVDFKAGERPISARDYGTHNDLDRSDSREANKAQEKDAAKALRDITEQAQKGLAEKAEKADREKQAELARYQKEIEQLHREHLGQ